MKKWKYWNALLALLVAGSLLACAGETATGAGAGADADAAVEVSEDSREASSVDSPGQEGQASDGTGEAAISAAEDAAGGEGTDAAAAQQGETAGSASVGDALLLDGEEDGQNPVMNFIGIYAMGRCTILVEPRGMANGADISVYWGSSASEHSEWIMSGDLDLDTLTIEYADCVRTNYVFNENGDVESEEVVYKDGKGRIIFSEGDLSLLWEDDQEQAANGSVFEYVSYGGASSQIANPWRDATQEEAKAVCTRLFRIPEGATDVIWSIMDAGNTDAGLSDDELMEMMISGGPGGDAVEAEKAPEQMAEAPAQETLDTESELPAGSARKVDAESADAAAKADAAAQEEDPETRRPLVEALFTLDGTTFTARAQQGIPKEEDISGMYYEWSATEDDSLAGWNLPAQIYAYVSEEESAQMCTWYDEDEKISYSLSAVGPDLDGLDITAVADFMCPEK